MQSLKNIVHFLICLDFEAFVDILKLHVNSTAVQSSLLMGLVI